MPKQKLARISITVPESTLNALDQKIVEQNYESRSQAIVDMINKHLIAEQAQANEVMVGTLTLLYEALLHKHSKAEFSPIHSNLRHNLGARST